jgi:hypothetical protein
MNNHHILHIISNMPDKSARGCRGGCKSCIRCWRNKLKHANRECKKFIKKQEPDYDKEIIDISAWVVNDGQKDDDIQSDHLDLYINNNKYTVEQLCDIIPRMRELWKNYFEAKSLSFYFDKMKEN